MVNLAYQDGATRPATSGIFIADVLGGTHAFGAIQAALYQREKTGQGQHIDVSMLEAMVGMLVYETQAAQFPGDPRRPLYKPLRTSDGFIMVAPTSPRNFEQLSEAVGHPEWQQDQRFRTVADRNANWAMLLDLVEEWSRHLPGTEAEAVLSGHGVPCALYRSVEEVLDDPQLAARAPFPTFTMAPAAIACPIPLPHERFAQPCTRSCRATGRRWRGTAWQGTGAVGRSAGGAQDCGPSALKRQGRE
jgi:crotonobetainyl-CoA:carnitine CoA-transferase CaiB-like acyl-CoA transferase